MFWFSGSLHLPAVTSAIPGLNSDLSQQRAGSLLDSKPKGPWRAKLHERVQNRTAVENESLPKRAIPKVEVLYVVKGCSETSVVSSRRRRGAKPPAVAAAAFEKTLRRLCSSLLRQRQDFEWSNSLQRCCGRPLCFLNGHFQQQHGMFSMEVEQQTRSHRTVPSQGRFLQPSHRWHRSQRSVRHIFSEHLDIVCAQQRPRLRGGHEYSQRHFQYRYSLPDCKVQIHLLRPCKQTQPPAQTARTQRGPQRREG